jgi:hypothetical protein
MMAIEPREASVVAQALLFAFVLLPGCEIMCETTSAPKPRGRLSADEPDRFRARFEIKANEITEADVAGSYYGVFPTGRTILELDPPRERYRFTIAWNSGRKYVSEWRVAHVAGLDKGRPLVSFRDIPLHLIRQEARPKDEGHMFPTRPLERELAKGQCDRYKRDSWAGETAYNAHRELVIMVLPEDPTLWLAKESARAAEAD